MMNAVDIAVIVVVLASGLFAFWRGFVHESLSMVAWIGAVFAALYGLPQARPLARTYVEVGWAADAIAGGTIFLVTLLALSLVTHAVSKRVRNSALNGVDRSLGFIFGLARGVLLISLAYMVVVWLTAPEKEPEWLAEAKTRPVMAQGAALVQILLPAEYGRAEMQARTAAEEARRAMELKKTYDSLANPKPKSEPGPQDKDSGYSQSERRDLDRLLRNNQ
ncbi:MAG: CvpA family protein [Alphaproteobacteria bacterium]|nr:CvpA family protein [Alphaproteobacteria bacterium]